MDSSSHTDCPPIPAGKKRPSEPSEEDNSSSTKKNKSEVDSKLIENVHTFNKWEKAELGDDDRKAKFLRLMGGAKAKPRASESTELKSSSAESSNVATHLSSVEDPEKVEKMEKDLETQFVHSMSDKLSSRSRRHCGLGYQETPLAATPGALSLGHLTTGMVKAESRASLDTLDVDKGKEVLPSLETSKTTSESKNVAAPGFHDVAQDKHMHFVSEGGREHLDL